MAFSNGNPNKINFLLTRQGKELLMRGGLESTIVYYSLWNDNFNYGLDVPPVIMPDLNGEEKSKVNTISLKYELTDGSLSQKTAKKCDIGYVLIGDKCIKVNKDDGTGTHTKSLTE